MPSAPIGVMSVEDNELVADVLARRLAHDDRFRWLGCVSDIDSLLTAVAADPPDVVCMDVDMPGQDPFTMIRALADRSPGSRVLILSGHTQPTLIEEAMEAGAWGYLSKADQPAHIVEGICRVARGELAFSEQTLIEYKRILEQRPAPDEPGEDRNGRHSSWNLFRFLRGERD
ncbi:MAG TPA: response regulator transcription factor [Phycisphaerales bacterium]|nr:response regulator transcription factor [Phycisphaerales bacterium]